MTDTKLDFPIGASGLPHDAQMELSEMLAILSERYDFKNGTTAAFWDLSFTLAKHLGAGKP